MPRQSTLGKTVRKGNLYWTTKIKGERVYFGQCAEVTYQAAHAAFLSAMASAGASAETVSSDSPSVNPPAVVSAMAVSAGASTGGMALGELVDLYNAYRAKHNAASSNAVVKGVLIRLMKFEDFAGRSVNGFTPADVLRWMNAISNGGSGRTDGKSKEIANHRSIQKYVVTFKGMINWGKKMGYVSEAVNPFKFFKGPAIERKNLETVKLITTDEKAKLMEIINGDTEAEKSRLSLHFFMLTGCRPSEFCRLTVADFDEANSRFILKDHKTAKSGIQRFIVLNQTGLKVAKRLMEINNGKLTTWKEGDGIQSWFNKFKARHKMARDGFTLYSFRHTLITELANNGVALKNLAVFFGTSASMIEKIYGKTENENLKSIAAMI